MGKYATRRKCFTAYMQFLGIFALFSMTVVRLVPDGSTFAAHFFPNLSVGASRLPRAFSSAPSGAMDGKYIPDSTAMCSITSKNYLGRVRTLVDSFQRHNPEVPVYVLVVDDYEGYIDPANETFNVIPLSALNIPTVKDMLFRYNQKEACTSFKPAFMHYLLTTLRIHKLTYLDPDIWVQDSFQELWDLLGSHSIVVTPHIVSPIPMDGKHQNDMKILTAGTFNLGFIAVSHAYEETIDFLQWWDERLIAGGAMVKIEDGYHYDQKWIDLAPSFYDHMLVLRDQAYNIAYWNLHERGHLVEKRDDGHFWLKASPITPDRRVVFFHFSGLRQENISQISHHQNRFTLEDLPNLIPVFTEYAEEHRPHVYPANMLSWPYNYDVFADGTPIAQFMRRTYRDMKDPVEFKADPFVTFLPWLRAPASESSIIPRFLYEYWKTRKDLQCMFPAPLEKGEALLSWYKGKCATDSTECVLKL